MLLKVDCLPNAVGKQPSIPLIYLGRKWTLNWWWWWWFRISKLESFQAMIKAVLISSASIWGDRSIMSCRSIASNGKHWPSGFEGGLKKWEEFNYGDESQLYRSQECNNDIHLCLSGWHNSYTPTQLIIFIRQNSTQNQPLENLSRFWSKVVVCLRVPSTYRWARPVSSSFPAFVCRPANAIQQNKLYIYFRTD